MNKSDLLPLDIVVLEHVRRHGPILRRTLATNLMISERQVRESIHMLNLAGYPIVSSGEGFHLATEPKSIDAAANRIRSQALSMLERYAALKKISLKEAAHQLSLFVSDDAFAE